jgi:hypothetical protein
MPKFFTLDLSDLSSYSSAGIDSYFPKISDYLLDLRQLGVARVWLDLDGAIYGYRLEGQSKFMLSGELCALDYYTLPEGHSFTVVESERVLTDQRANGTTPPNQSHENLLGSLTQSLNTPLTPCNKGIVRLNLAKTSKEELMQMCIALSMCEIAAWLIVSLKIWDSESLWLSKDGFPFALTLSGIASVILPDEIKYASDWMVVWKSLALPAQDDIDAILDKVSNAGIDVLSPAEKWMLQRF